MKKIYLFLLIIALNGTVFAGFNGVTHHSRANCDSNESVSWDWNNNWWFWVNSVHIHLKTGAILHTLVSGWQLTWRNVPVHWGEGRGGWQVHGLHWMTDSRGNPVLVQDEYVTDCSVYDGWWDREK